jgi:hypothetical protein
MEINLALNRLGIHPEPNNTPAERANNLISILPPSESPARILISEYQTATYSTETSIDIQAAQRAGSEIRLHSFKAFLQNLFDRGKDIEEEY